MRFKKISAAFPFLTHGFISEHEAKKAIGEAVQVPKRQEKYINQALHFTESLRQQLIEEYGEKTLYYGGLRIETSLDMRLQTLATTTLREGLRIVDKRQGYRGPLLRLPAKQKSVFLKALKFYHLQLWPEPKGQMNKSEGWDMASALDNLQNPQETLRALKKVSLSVGHILAVPVIRISDTQKTVIVSLGNQEATLPFSKMLWARPFNPQYPTPLPQMPSEVLQVGDIILARLDKIKPFAEVSLEQHPKVEGSLIAIEPFTHKVLALVGGYDYAFSHFNRALQAKRQPGSSFKPFFYGLAFEKNLFTPATLITDEPKIYADLHGKNEWKPRNVTRKFLGDIPIRTCLIRSVNTCSITILQKLGLRPLLDFGAKIQLNTPSMPFPSDLTLALGSADVIPLHFVNAYTIFPSLGQFAPPVMVEKIWDAKGKILFKAKENEASQVLSPEAAFLVTDILQGVVSALKGKHASLLSQPLAGKTGTTNQARSAWFVGYSPSLVAGAYVGFDDNASLGSKEYGAGVSFPIWYNFMQGALAPLGNRSFEEPEGIIWQLMDQKTGRIASISPLIASVGSDEISLDPDDPEQRLAEGMVMQAFIEKLPEDL